MAAGHQTGGRGRLGRTWSDEPGRALMFSVVLRPELDLRAGVCSRCSPARRWWSVPRPRRDGRRLQVAQRRPRRRAEGRRHPGRVERRRRAVRARGARHRREPREPPPDVPSAGAVADAAELLGGSVGVRPRVPTAGCRLRERGDGGARGGERDAGRPSAPRSGAGRWSRARRSRSTNAAGCRAHGVGGGRSGWGGALE